MKRASCNRGLYHARPRSADSSDWEEDGSMSNSPTMSQPNSRESDEIEEELLDDELERESVIVLGPPARQRKSLSKSDNEGKSGGRSTFELEEDSEILEIPHKEYTTAKQIREAQEAAWLAQEERNKRTHKERTKDRATRKNRIECCICYSLKGLWKSECGHICCKSCWEEWLHIRKKCPICRHITRIKNLTIVCYSHSAS